jgi:hypothetical protein
MPMPASRAGYAPARLLPAVRLATGRSPSPVRGDVALWVVGLFGRALGAEPRHLGYDHPGRFQQRPRAYYWNLAWPAQRVAGARTDDHGRARAPATRESGQSTVEDAMSELMQLRERVEGFVVPELQRQGDRLATVLADVNDAGASKLAEEQTPEGGGQAAER